MCINDLVDNQNMLLYKNTDPFTNPEGSGEPETYGAHYSLDEVSVKINIDSSTNEGSKSEIEIYPTLVKTLLHYKTLNEIATFKIGNDLGASCKRAESALWRRNY